MVISAGYSWKIALVVINKQNYKNKSNPPPQKKKQTNKQTNKKTKTSKERNLNDILAVADLEGAGGLGPPFSPEISILMLVKENSRHETKNG
jgi:hypothetical protein